MEKLLLEIQKNEERTLFLDILKRISKDKEYFPDTFPMKINQNGLEIKSKYGPGMNHCFEANFPSNCFQSLFEGEIRIFVNREKLKDVIRSIDLEDDHQFLKFYKVDEGLRIDYKPSEAGTIIISDRKPTDYELEGITSYRANTNLQIADIQELETALRRVELQMDSEVFRTIFVDDEIFFQFGEIEGETSGSVGLKCKNSINSKETSKFSEYVVKAFRNYVSHERAKEVTIGLNKREDTVMVPKIMYENEIKIEIMFAPR